MPTPFLKRCMYCCLYGSFLCSWPAFSWAQDSSSTTTLPEITIHDERDSHSPLAPNQREKQQELETTPGGVNLITPQDAMRVQTLQDALAHQPGIVIQEFFGGLDQPRLSIRGSGIQSNPVNRGVLLMQDGLMLNEADGSFITSTLEPRNSAHIAVRRGSNALHPGASTLGGEMDFQSVTGANNNRIDINAGSFGRRSLSAGLGGQGVFWDGRIFASHDRADGYRHHSASKRSNLHANAGWRSGTLENRSYFSYTDLRFDIPNVLPRSRLESDPRSVMGDYNTAQDQASNIYVLDPNRETRQLRIANRTHWGEDNLNHTVGFYRQHIDDTFTSPSMSTPTDGHTHGAQWTTKGRASPQLSYQLALHWSRSDMDREMRPISSDGERMPATASYDLVAENRSAHLGLSWSMTSAWTVLGDLRYAQNIRDARNRYTDQKLNQQWNAGSPKLGVLWQASPATQIFANISRSNEAPTYWEILSGTSMKPLDMQRAWTLEIGARGRYGQARRAGNWSLSLYRSKVRDELMEVYDDSGTSSGTFNYQDRTTHQGLELGVDGQWPLRSATLVYQLAWTWSDFQFDGGQYAGNRIAGVPRHLISAEIIYRQGAWSLGPTLRWQPSKTPTNHANTAATEQDSYALLGLRMSWQISRQLQAYASADNLTDRTYASAFVIRSTATAAMPTFLSGNGRSVNAGLRYHF
jgi:iron complex outermembrane receptor protein